MVETPEEKSSLLAQSTTIVYWCSMIFLLIGMQITINPYGKNIGEVKHILITFILFELYMWLLLRLGKWQHENGYINNNYRTIIFTFILTVSLIVALNELYLVSPIIATFCSIFTFGSAVMKARYASTVYKFRFSKNANLFLAGHLAILVFTPTILNLIVTTTRDEHLLGYLLSLMIAVWFGAHLLLIYEQVSAGDPLMALKSRLQQKITWLAVAIFSLFVVVQLYATMWSLDIKWAPFYITPIILSISLIVILCGQLNKMCYFIGTGFLFIVMVGFVNTVHTPFPKEVNLAAVGMLATPLRNGYIINGTLFCLIFTSMFLLIKSWWMLMVASALPACSISKTIIINLWFNKQSRGFMFIVASFILLAVGVMLQKQHLKLSLMKSLEKKENADIGQ